MDIYLWVKILHIISATILFGTGVGIAFFMCASHFAKNIHERYFAARMTVIADYCFTLPAVTLQPVTGAWLVMHGGFDAMDFWLKWTYALYIVAGICWLPVVWIQIQLRNMLAYAQSTGTELPHRYHQLFKYWFLLGWPAFAALMVIFYLMVVKPI